MAPLRNPLEAAGFDEEETDTLILSRRVSSTTGYARIFERYSAYCADRGLNNVTDVTLCKYLHWLMKQGYAYNTIRSAAIACSSFLPLLPSGVTVGSSPLVHQMLTGIKNQLPPKLPQRRTWDVSSVLAHLRANTPSTLLQLSRDTAVILALATGWRPRSDLERISFDHVEDDHTNGIRLLAVRPKESEFKEIFVRPTPEVDGPCPVDYLRRYIAATENLRKAGSNLFLATTHPHQSASGDTIAGWIVDRLAAAGIHDRAHSTRAAATSTAASRGVGLDQILAAANWASATTFNRFYRRDIVAESLPLPPTKVALPEAARAANGKSLDVRVNTKNIFKIPEAAQAASGSHPPNPMNT
jgi:site-specific recombinase XerD